MLEGNVCAAVRWLTECLGGGVLKPSDSTTIGGTSMTVFDALGLKHPDPCVPPDYALPSMDNLPFWQTQRLQDLTSYQLHISYREGWSWWV